MCLRRAGEGSRSALELLHTVNGKGWEDSTAVFTQVSKLGPKSIRMLAQNEITSWEKLGNVLPGELEMWLCRKPDFGRLMLEEVHSLPRFEIKVE